MMDCLLKERIVQNMLLMPLSEISNWDTIRCHSTTLPIVVKHSIVMPFVSRCKTFIEEEISRNADVEFMDTCNKNSKNCGVDTESIAARIKKKESIEPTF